VLLRRTAYEQLGGWDAALGVGLAEADFWLRGATEGMWGRDVPLVLARLPAASHSDAVAQALRGHHAALYRTGLPPLPPADERPFAPLPLALPFSDLRSLRGEPGKRLLLLLPFLDVGGVSSFALAMLDQLVARGYSCTVATTLPGAHPLHDAFARRAEVWLLEHFLLRADFPRFLRYLIESRGIDTLLLSNSLLGYRLLPFFRSYCPDLTIIDYNHMRDPDTANGGGPGFGAAYDALLDMHLASSDELRGWMVAHGADPARSHVVYTSIDAARWRPNPEVRAAVRAELGLGDEPLVLYAARLTPQKQPQVFARVVARLAARGLSFRCIVAGDGPDARALARFLRRHQLTDRVRMLGSVDSERVQKLMAASDILFLPSAYEGLALVLFEALASGVVPVSVDSGGQRELVTPDCGVLVAPDAHQEERYAAALEWLIRAPRQREQMARMGRARVVESFSITTMGAQLDELIGQARQLACTAPRERVGQGAASVAASLAVEELRHYQRNHRFRAALRAWEWWKAYGSRYNRRCSAIKERVALRISIWKGCRFN
jgi:glycosyltransferase involved in cell wall biosynthesis